MARRRPARLGRHRRRRIPCGGPASGGCVRHPGREPRAAGRGHRRARALRGASGGMSPGSAP
ncbi:hypothetical protein FVP33_14335 [Lacisediminihabitans profunda]|uniref:Uncharacterized protein n=1 Tax=Lacisediminihabitans profunda TaxID=2594790 RepID=A0A5C8UNA9_9MICO|nr:hypothetical protein FVP33_14335 [Lacisediminihabitans profunda]